MRERMFMELADLILEPYAGAHIGAAYADARRLVALTGHPIIVRGNNTDVTVTATMDEAACRTAYEAALVRSGQRRSVTP